MSENIEIIKSNCPRDCYDGCGISIEKTDGRISRVMGDEAHPVSRGRLCNKCAIAYNGVWQDENERLPYPLKRTGEKGKGLFERISWDEAVDTITDRLKHDIANHGPEAIVHTHYSGTLSLMALMFPMRFFIKLGAAEVDPDSICNAAGHAALSLLYGESHVGFDPRTIRDSNCVLIWGANPSHSGPHSYKHWFAASDVKKIVVDPLSTKTAGAADYHLQLYPGTDAALAYSLLHVMQREGLFDDEFVNRHTNAGEAEVYIHPLDATGLGIRNGDPVTLSNDSGSLRLTAAIEQISVPGVIVSYKGRWPKKEGEKHNVNVLHSGQKADMAESTSVPSTLVTLSPHSSPIRLEEA